MRKQLMALIISALTICNSILAEDILSISNIEITPGGTIDVSISLENDETYVAFQFDLVLPEGFYIYQIQTNPERVPASTTLSEKKIWNSDNTSFYRFLATAMQSEPIIGNSGDIIRLQLSSYSSIEQGELTGYFRNVKLSKADATGPTYESFQFPISVYSAIITANSYKRDYGDENPTFEYRVVGSSIEGEPAISCSASPQSPVGEYEIKIEKGTITNSSVKLVNGTLTVDKAPLTITAKSYTIMQREALPTLEATYTGFKNNETETVLTTKPTLTTTATSASEPGIYEIAVSGAEAQIYEISYIKGSLTITERPSYTLTYIVDGTTYKTLSIKEGSAITPEAEPTKEGYTFSGWSDIPETMPAHDVTVTGTFTINKYKLIYKVDGVEYKSFDIEYGATITPEADPTKEGYTFSGWSEIPETMPAHDITVTGTFSINKYKLTYIVDNVEYKTYEVEYGATITPEPAPTKEGFNFSGWSLIPGTMPAHDVTVTGSFTKGSYKLVYMVDSETYKIISYDYGAAITPEAAPTKEGYTFSGWSEIPETMPAHDVTVTGTFTINKYKLIYKVDDVEYKSLNIEYGATITPEDTPTKEGYTFSGWSEIPETMPAHDVTVSGTFSINSYKLTYMFDNEVYKEVTYEYGATIMPEVEPTKEGYTFSGWSEIPETMPAHDVTVTGIFSINSYKLTYIVDGVEYKSFDIEYGATITPEAEPTKEGYTFSGWSEIPETMPAHDVTVTGTFNLDSTGINQIMRDENGNTMIFTIDGRRVDKPQKNLNIIRMKDGTTRKVIVK